MLIFVNGFIYNKKINKITQITKTSLFYFIKKAKIGIKNYREKQLQFRLFVKKQC